MGYTMYETLLQLPLFQGMSKAELSEIIERVKFHFQKFETGNILFSQGDICDKIVFLLSGEIEIETVAPCGSFSFAERYNRPMILEFHSLFGIAPKYKATYTTLSNTALLTIDKQYMYNVLDRYEVFRMNLLNLLCNRTELLHNKIWSIKPEGLEGRLIHFIKSLCTTPQGSKILRIKMEDLASLLDDTRLNISNILNKWRNEGLIEMHRKEFIFHDVERLKTIQRAKSLTKN